MTTFSQLRALSETADGFLRLLEPPDRRRVSDVVGEEMFFGEGQRWDVTEAPYMARPLDCTESRQYNVVCFVGPARTGKTGALVQGRTAYIITHRPKDTMIVHSSESTAQRFSDKEMKLMQRYSPGIAAQMTGRSNDDNVYSKQYRSGLRLLIGWPSNKQLASLTLTNIILTDYGRWPGNVGGEGSGFEQALKRIQVAGSLGMCVVESSPSGEVIDPQGSPIFELGKPLSHAFPSTSAGTLADICPIYNAGTREWLYTPCSACGEYYPQRPSIEAFSWPDDETMTTAQRAARGGVACCWCGSVHGDDAKREELKNAVWLAEGEVIDCYGRVSGDSRKGETYPSFSLGGGAAAYQSRASIIDKYLRALATARDTGDEHSLKFVVNADIGAPFTPISKGVTRQAHPLMMRAEPLEQWAVPEGVRFIVAAVDVQINRFVVQIIGHGEHRQRWVIDRYNLARSDVLGEDGKPYTVDPARRPEDWRLLDRLIEKSYPLADGSGRRMRVMLSVCDMGGAEGVSDNAYAYFRSLGKDPDRRHLAARFRLIKGEHKATAPLIEERWPDTRGRRDRSASRGDVPVLFVNSNRIKDMLDNALQREDVGPGYYHFPQWLPPWFYDEVTREQKQKDGTWPTVRRNEAWDLMVYAEAAAIWGLPVPGARATPRGVDTVDWQNPPPWAAPWDANALVFDPEDTATERDSRAGKKKNLLVF